MADSQPTAPASPIQHISPRFAVGRSGYVNGCRCDGCVDAARAYQRTRIDYRRAREEDLRRTPEGRALVLKRSRRKWSAIKKDADRKARHRAATKARRDRLRLWLNGVKIAAGCVDCGYNKHPAALDFDHVRGPKLFCVGAKLTHGRRQVLDEIAKCVVRCANCHRIKTHDRLDLRGG